MPTFEDVTEAAGLKPLAMKAPHVEIQDFDNDGWPDIYVSIVKFKDGKPYPVIFRNLGVKDGIPRFRDDAWAVNDFPTAEDLAISGPAQFFDKMMKEKKIIYMAAGPSATSTATAGSTCSWPTGGSSRRSLLLRNETPGGNWLDVRVEGSDGRQPHGHRHARSSVYPAGKLGEAAALLGCREIAVGYGYCSGQEAVAHFGLGKEDGRDILEVMLPHGKGKVEQKGVKANQRLTVKR